MDEMLYRLLQDSTVRLNVEDRRKATGCYVAPATVPTCAHIVENSNAIRVYWRGREYVATVFAMASPDANNLALVKLVDLPLDHPCVYLHDSIRPGDTLYSFGYPANFAGGDSSRFECEGLSIDPTWIKFTRGQVVPGLSSSPLLNERTGGVCGVINRPRDTHSALGSRAIPVSTVFSSFPDLKQEQQQYHHQNTHWLRS